MRQASLLLFAVTLYAADPRPYFGEPSLAPDASEIAFVSGGDIWTVASAGGDARLLVSNPATESRPLYSPDGKRLAFTSNRTGNGDVYVLTLASGEIERLTVEDSAESVEAWSPDSQWIYFSSNARNIGSTTDVYRVHAGGGTPMQVSADRFTTQYFAAPSPDGQILALNGHGVAGSQWWRKGHSHLDESEIWLRREGSPASYEKITEGGAKEVWPMWSKDGKGLYYVSDRSGAQNVWYKPLNGKARQITQFTDSRVLWPSISQDGRAIAFERDFRIWKLDTGSGKAAVVEITRRGAPAGPTLQHVVLTGEVQMLALAPDGKKVAFLSHGEVFAAQAKDGSDAARLTRTAAAESSVIWSPDSKTIAYVSDRAGEGRIFTYEFATSKKTQMTSSGWAKLPRFSPDGKSLAYFRDSRELRVLDLASGQERTVASGHFDADPDPEGPPLAWSPDSQWLAYIDTTGKAFNNVMVVPAAGGSPKQVSFLANFQNNGIRWSPDGKYLLTITGQRTEPNKVARVDLLPRTPQFREDQFWDLFKETGKPGGAEGGGKITEPAKAAEKTPAPVKIDFDEIRRRLTLLPIDLDVSSLVISPDGKWVVFTASSAGQENLYAYSLDELAREPAVPRQLTSTPGNKGSLQFTPDSKEVYFLDRGRLFSVSLESRQPKAVGITAEMDVDFAAEKTAVFEQAWSLLRDNFFDPNFHGADWKSVHEIYEPLIAGAATPDEMRRLLSLMVGELNASHLGANPPPNPNQNTTGRLGIRFNRTEYEANGRFQITEVIALGPADIAGIKAGDVIEAVDGVMLDAKTNFDALLDHKTGKRVTLQVSGREVAVLPISTPAEKNLLYRAWVEQNRAYVSKTSNGRLGYVHMNDMSAGSLNQLYIDLDAENQTKDGVVIDIRNNNGGFVNAYALDIFARRPYLRFTPRGFDEAPARALLGQRALDTPTVLVVNQHSLSDAEDFTEGYRTLQLGKVVGEPTAGWIIYTSNRRLLDGTVFRVPGWRVRNAAGEDLEMHPRRVDVAVSRPLGESYTGKDSQLDAAVKSLLGDLK